MVLIGDYQRTGGRYVPGRMKDHAVCAVCGLPIVRLSPRLWRHVGTLPQPWVYHAIRVLRPA
jgi:hypothetical protein